jgi:hypothetical protein
MIVLKGENFVKHILIFLVLVLIVVLVDLSFILKIGSFYNNFKYVSSILELTVASSAESSFFSRTNNTFSLHFVVISFCL